MRAVQAEPLSERPQSAAGGRPAHERAARVSYLGHATVLVEVEGLRLLTDPLLRPRLGHLRRRAPLPEPESLGRIDAVLVSHAHRDHLDLATIERLAGSPPVIGPGSVTGAVAKLGNRFRELRVGGTTRIGGIEIEGLVADHDGGRLPVVGSREAIGFLAVPGGEGDGGAGPTGIYFAGDTDIYAGMAELRGRVDAALVPISGWGPRVGPGHLNPDSAAKAIALIQPRRAIPIHWGTYQRIGMDASPAALREPVERFADQLSAVAPEVELEVLPPGVVSSAAEGAPGS